MPLFWKPYKSDFTAFLDDMKAKKPSIEENQRAGRALLWDRPVDIDAQAEYKASRVAQRPYVYANTPDE